MLQGLFPGVELGDRVGAVHCDLFRVMEGMRLLIVDELEVEVAVDDHTQAGLEAFIDGKAHHALG